MKILTINCGSSSIKFRLFEMPQETELAKGLVERVGTERARLHLSSGERSVDRTVGRVGAADHRQSLGTILEALVEVGAIRSTDEIDGMGHRVVHGGAEMHASCVIDADVLACIERNCELAPLHNPPNLAGIAAARQACPDVPHVAVFDTAFLSTLPPVAYRYAVPETWLDRFGVRKYGFHGTSHRYVTMRAAELLGRGLDQVNLITAHLGNGCSMTAVAGGVAVDHSMGMTPLSGLVMGTRCGDLDAGAVLHLADRGLSCDQIDKALNNDSGLLGLSGRSNDMRDLLAAIAAGDARAELAVEIFVYRLVQYVGAYYTILPSVDALVLTGGIGENAPAVREKICSGLARLGAVVDRGRNERAVGGCSGAITTDGAALPVWVVPTNEELMIARDTLAAVEGGR